MVFAFMGTCRSRGSWPLRLLPGRSWQLDGLTQELWGWGALVSSLARTLHSSEQIWNLKKRSFTDDRPPERAHF